MPLKNVKPTPEAPDMGLFGARFPRIFDRDAKIFAVSDPTGGLPIGEYVFLDHYCNNPFCDCRRVMFRVVEYKSYETLAYIHYGWESEEFYRKLSGSRHVAHRGRTAVLDPDREQSELAPALLKHFQKFIRRNEAFVGQLREHYEMFKRAVTKSSGVKGRNYGRGRAGGEQSHTE